jgi:AcrR family transcriptional regulator
VIGINEHPLRKAVFLRDPQQTDFGRRLLSESILLIDTLGLEDFTFKRLAQALSTAEASVYRYFENKHRLLVYLVSWYWQWLDECLVTELYNLQDPEERLRRALRVVITGGANFTRHAPPHRAALYRLVVAEASKAYLTKAVDTENREGLFLDYKKLCGLLADLVISYMPAYPYPHALMSTVIESARKQQFFAQHLPSLTDFKNDNLLIQNMDSYLQETVFAALKSQQSSALPPTPNAH